MNEPEALPLFNARPYNADRDREAVHRIWRECGWLTKKDEEDQADAYIESARAFVSELEGEAECLVLSHPGTIRYLVQDLPFAGVTGVTTSRIARKLGLARRLTAHVISLDAQDGAAVEGLGMFEQGFYNRLGFGTGSYEHWVAFDPARLKPTGRHRIPKRFDKNDGAAIHRARLRRARFHGGCNLDCPALTTAEMGEENQFGLGYANAEGEWTHGLWFAPKAVDPGPYNVVFGFWQTREEWLELLALIRSLGDQVRSVGMREPPGIMFQDFLQQPFKERSVTRKSSFESKMSAEAYLQFRIVDLPGCLERTRLPGGELRFNLRLRDPMEESLPPESKWRGVAGDFVVSLGPVSGAEPGRDGTLATLDASVGAFTRLWLGVVSATGLSFSDDLSGPPELLEALDYTLRLPAPRPDWDF